MAASRHLAVGLLALATLAGGEGPAGAAAVASGPEFLNARLGMSLKEWRAVPIPPGAGPKTIAVCTRQDRTVAASRSSAPSARLVPTGVVVCRYKALAGPDVVGHSVEIDPKFRAQDVAFVFRHGRLGEIRFKIAEDAYDDVRMTLGLRRKGGPIDLARGLSRPRVWTLTGARVTIARGPNPSELAVVLARR